MKSLCLQNCEPSSTRTNALVSHTVHATVHPLPTSPSPPANRKERQLRHRILQLPLSTKHAHASHRIPPSCRMTQRALAQRLAMNLVGDALAISLVPPWPPPHLFLSLSLFLSPRFPPHSFVRREPKDAAPEAKIAVNACYFLEVNPPPNGIGSVTVAVAFL